MAAEGGISPIGEISYNKLYLLLGLGLIILILGCLMIGEVRVWESLGGWFSVAMVLLGLLMIGSESYSTPLGVFFLLTGCAILFHQAGIFKFPYLTTILGGVLVLLGAITIFVAAIKFFKKVKKQ